MSFIKRSLFRFAIYSQFSDRIERNKLICIANPLTGFYIRCFVQFGIICTISKMRKHPWRSVNFSKVAG